MSIISDAKEILDLVKKYNNQDLYERIVKLREDIIDLRGENVALREERDELKRAAETTKKLRRGDNCYYLEGEKPEHPYCMTCWDVDRKLVSMHHSDAYGGTHYCEFCTTRGR